MFNAESDRTTELDEKRPECERCQDSGFFPAGNGNAETPCHCPLGPRALQSLGVKLSLK